jgi:NADP-reducing hydrogenase subunit HndB
MNIEQLKKIKQEASLKMRMSNQKGAYRIVVGMATCGITAGAKPVYDELIKEVAQRNLQNVSIVQVGCIGECALEPIVEVFDSQGFATTYCKVKPLDIERIIDNHIVNGFVVEDLLMARYKKIGGYYGA